MRTRPIADGDWAAIESLESGEYSADGLSEDPAALRSRADGSPATCFVLDAGDRLAGYLLALPYPAARCPDLSRAELTTYRGTNLHLHDLVVAPGFRGRGRGAGLVRTLTAAAQALGYRRISLVAVHGSTPFWAAQGFRAVPGVVVPAHYGPDAAYLARPTTAGAIGAASM